jgi:hypothetical protein
MKRIILLSMALLCTSEVFATVPTEDVNIGNVYKIDDGMFIPVFSKPGTEFKHESGSRMSDCRDLDTILLPGFHIRVEEIFEDGILRVTATADNSYVIRGYVHRKFVEDCTVDRGRIDFKSLTVLRANVSSINEITTKIKNLLSMNVRYCYGGNCPYEIKLDGLYKFHSTYGNDKNADVYRCQGFDSSGLIHYISDGWLPHNTNDLFEFGIILYAVDTNKQLRSELAAEILDTLYDTDLIMFTSKSVPGKSDKDGHVVMFYKLGFVEYTGRFSGIVRTVHSEAASRLAGMYAQARALGVPLFVIRWHPELLREKK